MIHGLELPIQAQDITDGKLPSGAKAQACIQAEALNYIVINNFLFRIDTHRGKDQDKENSVLLVIPEKYEPIIFHTYHDSLLAGHQFLSIFIEQQ